MNETDNNAVTKRGIRIDKVKRLEIMEVFRLNSWNKSKTSEETGIGRKTLARWIKDDKTAIKPVLVKNENKRPSIEATIKAVIPTKLIAMGVENLSDHIATSKKLRELTLNRITDLIAVETDVDKLTKLLTALTKYLDTVEVAKGPAESPITAIVNNIQANFVGNEEMKLFIAEKLSQLKDNL